MTGTPLWRVIHMTHSMENARSIIAYLERESFLVRYRRVSAGAEEAYYEILVPGGEAREAQQLLIEGNLLLS